MTPEFTNAFVHTDQSNTRPCPCLLKTLQHVRRHSASVVSNLKNYSLDIQFQPNIHRGTSRVAMDVSQAFLQHPEKAKFHRVGKPHMFDRHL